MEQREDELMTIEEVSEIMGKSLSITRQYKKWKLFKVRKKDGRREYFSRDEVERAKGLFEQYIVDRTDATYQEVCEEIAKELYS